MFTPFNESKELVTPQCLISMISYSYHKERWKMMHKSLFIKILYDKPVALTPH